MTDLPTVADIAYDAFTNGSDEFGLLYKYQTINDYSLDALAKNYLYFSSFPQLNDPFDPFLHLLFPESDLANAFLEKGPRIFCASAEPCSPLLWAHYGNSGAGMCISYAVSAGDGNGAMFNPVKYIDDFSQPTNLFDALRTKSTPWAYEKEWRAIIAKEDPLEHNFAHPVTVTLGSRCTHEDMLRVKSALPPTVKAFSVIYPTFREGEPSYEYFEVDSVVEAYGRLLTHDELIAREMTRRNA